MVSVTSSWLYCLSLLSLFPFISSSITIPLQYPQTNQIPFQDQYQKLNHLVTTSLARARHLKNPQPTPAATATAPLFSHSYGGYSISLSFGTPPQTLSFIMDTGSDVVWFPCTSRYLCKHCSFSSSSSSPRIQPFIPKESSSSKIIGCKNPKCSWIHQSNINCDQDCSKLSISMAYRGAPFSLPPTAGIAGFGRGLSSLPSQLGLMPYKYLSPGEDGNGGVIIDSATTFTFIAREAFEPLSDEFIRQITDYKRIKEFEDVTGQV
uniref:Peptidase A1 domain-containing protein n=1 Tax=Salix viminalis TaxID=40686 RepID=A0A6N2MF59_SALVM